MNYYMDKRGTRWESFDPTDPHTIEARPGCYVIYLGGRLVYVGQSENVKRRIKGYRCVNRRGAEDMRDGHTNSPWGPAHWRDGGLRGKVRNAARFGEQLMTEARLIYRIRPPFNRRGLGDGR